MDASQREMQKPGQERTPDPFSNTDDNRKKTELPARAKHTMPANTNTPGGPRTGHMTQTAKDKHMERAHALHVYWTQIMWELHRQELNNPVGDINLISLAASMADEDTMYLHKALRAPDKKEFLKAMQDEVATHSDREH